MAECTLSIQQTQYNAQTNIATGSSSDITIPFTSTISPEQEDNLSVLESSLTINVRAGLNWAGNVGNRTLRINSITLKSSETTYALYDTPFEVYGAGGSGQSKEVQLTVTNPTTFINDVLSGASISCVMNLTNVSGRDSWSALIRVNEQEVIFNTRSITANTPGQICGEIYPTFSLTGTTNGDPDTHSYRWEYSEQGLNSWVAFYSGTTSLDFTCVITDPSINRGKTYDVSVVYTTDNIRSNIVALTLYDAPSVPSARVEPNYGVGPTIIDLRVSPFIPPGEDVCSPQYQWQYNNGTPDEWLPLDGATNLRYTGQFTATTPETQFRLRVIGAGGAGYSDPVTYTAYIPTFPLNVEIGSPQYTTVSQINYSEGTGASIQVTPATSGTTPVNNSYYTFQSQDGQYWMTAYVGKWTNNDGKWTADLIWSSSNTDTLPAQSICWCVWTKEYYDSLITQIGSGGGGAVIKSIEYDLPTTTFTITDTNDEITEIDTSPSFSGIELPPYNFSDLMYEQSGAPLIRFGYHTGLNVRNISEMDIATPVLSQTHEIYFDVSGTDLYVRKESPAGMYEPLLTYRPIVEGKDSIVVRWRENDVIRFHVPEDNFGSNYSVNISCNSMVVGWKFIYIYTDSHTSGESNLPSNSELPRHYLNSTSNIVYIYCSSRAETHLSSSAYEIHEVTISISRRSTSVPEVT